MLFYQNYDQYAYLDKDRRSSFEYHMQQKNDDVGKGCLIKE